MISFIIFLTFFSKLHMTHHFISQFFWLFFLYNLYLFKKLEFFILEHASVPESEPIIVNRVEEPVDEAEEREEEASKSETEEERNQSPEDNKAAEGKPLTVRIQFVYQFHISLNILQDSALPQMCLNFQRKNK